MYVNTCRLSLLLAVQFLMTLDVLVKVTDVTVVTSEDIALNVSNTFICTRLQLKSYSIANLETIVCTCNNFHLYADGNNFHRSLRCLNIQFMFYAQCTTLTIAFDK